MLWLKLLPLHASIMVGSGRLLGCTMQHVQDVLLQHVLSGPMTVFLKSGDPYLHLNVVSFAVMAGLW
jgi:siroheme synthase